jgi:hypothetical protein
MPRIAVDDVRAWVESSKLNVQAVDNNHCTQIEEEILARIGGVYDTSTWVDQGSTPRLIRVIIAKMYVGWLYDKLYSENQSVSNRYARLIKDNAETLIEGVIDGTIEIPGVTALSSQAATFYPNDASSALTPTADDPSLGPAKFSLGKTF